MKHAPAVDDRMTAGAGIYYPATLPGQQTVHLARTEARKGRAPALFAICPSGPGGELERAERKPWYKRARWCPACEAYREHVRHAHGEI